MNTVIEIHDSRVAGIAHQDGSVIVHFQPAYLHKSEGRPGIDAGTGWVQEARLTFAEAVTSGDFPDWPRDIIDGGLTIGSERHPNRIPVPLETATPTELSLIFDDIHTVTIKGRRAKLELIGESKYIEEFKP